MSDVQRTHFLLSLRNVLESTQILPNALVSLVLSYISHVPDYYVAYEPLIPFRCDQCCLYTDPAFVCSCPRLTYFVARFFCCTTKIAIGLTAYLVVLGVPATICCLGSCTFRYCSSLLCCRSYWCACERRTSAGFHPRCTCCNNSYGLLRDVRVPVCYCPKEEEDAIKEAITQDVFSCVTPVQSRLPHLVSSDECDLCRVFETVPVHQQMV
jgi:hypothetical protein